MQYKIQVIEKRIKIDYSNEVLRNFWMLKNEYRNTHTTANFSDGYYGTNFRKEGNDYYRTINKIIELSSDVLCLQTSKFTDESIIESIFNLLNKNISLRIYILLNEYSENLNIINNKTLIRYGVPTNGSYIIDIYNNKGLFFTGNLTKEDLTNKNHILFSFGNSQGEISKLYRHFCYNFWEKAKQEVIQGFHREISSKPFDIFHNVNEYEGKDFVYATLFDFVSEKKKGELLGNKIIICGEENGGPKMIDSENTITLNDISLSYLPDRETFESMRPEKFQKNDFFLKTTYVFKIIPFYLPEGSKRHSLYRRWEEEKTKILRFIDKISQQIIEIEKKENKLSSRITRFFLGKKTKLSDFKQEIEDIKKINFSSFDSAILKEIIDKLNNLYREIENDLNEIEKEEKSARIDEEIERLQSSKNEKEQKLKEKKIELEEKIKEKNSLNSDNKNQELDEKRKKEIEIFIKKKESEIENLEKEIKGIERNIELKIKEKKSTSSGKESVLSEIIKTEEDKKDNFNRLEIQNLPFLPKVGELYEFENISYLAIRFWEEYEGAKKEAERLKAKICVSR